MTASSAPHGNPKIGNQLSFSHGMGAYRTCSADMVDKVGAKEAEILHAVSGLKGNTVKVLLTFALPRVDA